jgi:hypothetical protein
MSAATIDFLQREISNPDTQWSLGTFGAIAEFSRDHGEPARLVQSAEAVSAVTLCGRNGRTSIRVALRQMKAEGFASSALGAWLASFDSASSDESDDEAALHHNS